MEKNAHRGRERVYRVDCPGVGNPSLFFEKKGKKKQREERRKAHQVRARKMGEKRGTRKYSENRTISGKKQCHSVGEKPKPEGAEGPLKKNIRVTIVRKKKKTEFPSS